MIDAGEAALTGAFVPHLHHFSYFSRGFPARSPPTSAGALLGRSRGLTNIYISIRRMLVKSVGVLIPTDVVVGGFGPAEQGLNTHPEQLSHPSR